MDDITSRIRLFHGLYAACLSGAVISACISAVLYLYLDIRTAVRVLAGVKKAGRPKHRKSLLPKETDNPVQAAKVSGSQDQTVALSVRPAGELYEKTDLMHPKAQAFFVEKEILVVHTDVTVSDGLPG